MLEIIPPPSVPAVLPEMTEAVSTESSPVVEIPPPSPAALFPEMVVPWMTVCLSPGPAASMKIPPPSPLIAPFIWVAVLPLTVELLKDMRARSATQMPPPLPTEPAPASATELF